MFDCARGQYTDALLQLRDLSSALLRLPSMDVSGPGPSAQQPLVQDLNELQLSSQAGALRHLCIATLRMRARVVMECKNETNSAGQHLIASTESFSPAPMCDADAHSANFVKVGWQDEQAWGLNPSPSSSQEKLNFWQQEDREIDFCYRSARHLAPHSARLAYQYASFLYDSAMKLSHDGVEAAGPASIRGGPSDVHALYRGALQNYFAFLRLTHGSSTVTGAYTSSAVQVDVTVRSFSHEDHTISSTLRILRLLVKYCDEFQNVFTMAIAETPLGAWGHILPQLCSRLRHPDAFVAAQVRTLLQRIATSHPHKLLPTLVADTTDGNPSLSSSSTDDNLGHNGDAIATDGVTSNQGMQYLKGEMRRCHPSLVATTERLFHELVRLFGALLFTFGFKY